MGGYAAVEGGNGNYGEKNSSNMAQKRAAAQAMRFCSSPISSVNRFIRIRAYSRKRLQGG